MARSKELYSKDHTIIWLLKNRVSDAVYLNLSKYNKQGFINTVFKNTVGSRSLFRSPKCNPQQFDLCEPRDIFRSPSFNPAEKPLCEPRDKR